MAWGHYSKFTGQDMVRLADNSFCFFNHLFLPQGVSLLGSNYLGADFHSTSQAILFLLRQPIKLENKWKEDFQQMTDEKWHKIVSKTWNEFFFFSVLDNWFCLYQTWVEIQTLPRNLCVDICVDFNIVLAMHNASFWFVTILPDTP